ncbi:DUF927 domain-containing protein [Pseudodesulfovibrio sp. zrk46]|uniref:DUF927 domain-containing protein n=1 Tax=Pseudodesulfovibrio sp. zrk46 TaxID=2725288 RepID=UPI001B35894D|nr:DUF927 domain-containing protein [Pseudodesulfovibrio sp. zrk46]
MGLDFEKVKQVVLAKAKSLVEKWLPGGKFQGDEYVVRNPTREDNNPGSFSINIVTGCWNDFATDDGGRDLVHLYQYLNGYLDWPQAAFQLADELGIEVDSAKRPRKIQSTKAQWTPITPVPENAPGWPIEHYKLGTCSNEWVYRDAEGHILFVVCRFDLPSGGKEIRPFTYCDDGRGNRAWRMKGLPGLRPLYGLDLLASATPDKKIVITEGEKAAKAARELLGEEMVVMTWPGGSKAVTKADWTPLANRDVLILVDADKPGFEAGLNIAAIVQAKSCEIVLPYAEAPKGWDIADAPDWSKEDLLAWIEANKMGLGEFKTHAAERYGIQPQHAAPVEQHEPGFALTDKGVVFRFLDREGNPEETWVCSYLEILAATHDENNENWGLHCRVKDPDGKLHTFTMPLESLYSRGKEYLILLVNKGLRIGADRKSNDLLLKYLTQADPEQRALSVTRTGWHGDRFVLLDRSYGPAGGLETVFQGQVVDNPYQCRGTLDEWQNGIGRLAVGNSRLVFAISTTFAAVLLELVGMESGIINFVGASSIGKTTILMAAASVCGGNGYIMPWRATGNGLEALAASRNDMPLLMDELSQCSSKELAEATYMFANGMGKARAKKTGASAPIQRWRLLGLSSSELSFEQKLREDGFKAMAGQSVRFMDIQADAGQQLGAFEQLHGFKDGDAFANEIRKASGACYGTPIRAFLERVAENKSEVRKQVRYMVDVFYNANLPENADGQVKRVCKRTALIASAGMLATKLGILPWSLGIAHWAANVCFQNWIAFRGGVGSSEASGSIKQIREFLEKHGSSRFELIGDNDNLTDFGVQNRAGFRSLNRYGKYEYYVLSEVFAKELCDGYNPLMVCRELRKLGLLLEQPGGRGFQINKKLPGLGQTKVYGLKADIISA